MHMARRGIYKKAESGEECDLAAAQYKCGALYRITEDLDHNWRDALYRIT